MRESRGEVKQIRARRRGAPDRPCDIDKARHGSTGRIDGGAMNEDECAKGRWSDLAQSGAVFARRVTPGARRNAIKRDGSTIRVSVTAPPEDGKANAVVATVLAQALGVAKSRLTLIRGATSRDKVFQLDKGGLQSI